MEDGQGPAASNVASYRGVGGRSSFKEPSSSPQPTPLPALFLPAPSGSHYTPAHAWEGGRAGALSARPCGSRPRRNEGGWGRGGGKRADWPEARFPLVRNLSPARHSTLLSGWRGPGLVLHSGLARGPLGLRWGQERRGASLGGISVAKILFSMPLSPKHGGGE